MENTNNNSMPDEHFDLDFNFDIANFLDEINTDMQWNANGEQPLTPIQVQPPQTPQRAIAQRFTTSSPNWNGVPRQMSLGEAYAVSSENTPSGSRHSSIGQSFAQMPAAPSDMGYGNYGPPELAVDTFQPIPDNQIGNYVNPVFYGFGSPLVPLSVIDQFFSQGLPRNLSDMLGTQLRAEKKIPSQPYQAPSSPQTPAEVEIATIAPKRKFSEVEADSESDSPLTPKRLRRIKAATTRSQNRVNFDPTRWYTPRAQPAPWGPINKETGKHLFTYTSKGELTPLETYTPEQLSYFLENHPLNFEADGKTRKPDMKKTGLICWIQSVPADSKARYGHTYSSLCLFSNCSDPRRTIGKGDFRIAFDEHSYADIPATAHDPFQVAGYVHLTCFERFMNFPRYARRYDFRPDCRDNLPEGKNRLAINRDCYGMRTVVDDYIASFTWKDPSKFAQSKENGEFLRPEGEEWYKYSLNYALTKTHIANQSVARIADRNKRGSDNSVQKHMNNLVIYNRTRTARLEAKRAASKKGKDKGKQPKAKSKKEAPLRKRQRPVSSDDSDEDDDDGPIERPTKMVKRVTRSSVSGYGSNPYGD